MSVHSIIMDAIAVTVAKDLIRLSAPADAVLVIHEVTITQESEAGDSNAEMLAAQVHRASDNGTGTAGVFEKMEEGDNVTGATGVTNLTADTTPTDILRRKGFHAQNGFEFIFDDDVRPVISPSGRFVLRLDKAPGSSITVTAEIVFEELGG